MTDPLFDVEHGSDAWLIHELRTRPRREGWAQIMILAAKRLEQLTDPKETP